MRILIIEDEVLMAAEMAAFLKKISYTPDIAYTAGQARKKMDGCAYDFVLLDLGLPDEDGMKLLPEVKKMCPDAAYLILTARGQLEDRIRGLDAGADDYLSKPFSLLELQSRMQAIARRKFGMNEASLSVGDFCVDPVKRTVLYGENEVNLSRKEFDLLSYLLLHRNKPLTRTQLGDHLWGDAGDEDYDSNYIDVHIKNIRKKLGQFADVDWLQTIRGVGYKVKIQP